MKQWRLLVQPNGLIARFSEQLNGFTDGNMSEAEAIGRLVGDYGCTQEEAEEALASARKSEENDWTVAMGLVKVNHGEDRANMYLAAYSAKWRGWTGKPNTDEDAAS